MKSTKQCKEVRRLLDRFRRSTAIESAATVAASERTGRECLRSAAALRHDSGFAPPPPPPPPPSPPPPPPGFDSGHEAVNQSAREFCAAALSNNKSNV